MAHSIVSLLVFRSADVLSVFPPFHEIHTYQIFSDLGVSLSIVMLFIYREIKLKKKRMIAFVFCGVATLLFGSFAPLIFLLINQDLFD